MLCYLYFARRLVHATGKYSMVRLCVCVSHYRPTSTLHSSSGEVLTSLRELKSGKAEQRQVVSKHRAHVRTRRTPPTAVYVQLCTQKVAAAAAEAEASFASSPAPAHLASFQQLPTSARLCSSRRRRRFRHSFLRKLDLRAGGGGGGVACGLN